MADVPIERLVVSSAFAGERLDRCLATVTGQPRALAARAIDLGRVRVNGRIVTVRHGRLESGDVVEFERAAPAVPDLPRAALPGTIEFTVVHADASVIVIDKPAGLVVHPGAGHRDDTLVSGLLARFPDLGELVSAGRLDPMRPGIVHRLDRDTSGLLVVARTEQALDELASQLAARTMHREYLALALGEVANEQGVIEAPIGRSQRAPTKMAVTASGRPARTHYRVLARYDGPTTATLLRVSLETGRTHQIRVHLRAIGHPVLGDLTYGGRASLLPLGRPFLHAARLQFVHPARAEQVAFESRLPDELERVLELVSLRPIPADRPAPEGGR